VADAERILSQNEVDALLSAIDSAVPEMGADAAAVMPHDFRKPSRPSAAQIRGVEVLHEGFARRASEALSALLRAPVEVKVAGANALSVRDGLASMPSPAAVLVLSGEPGGTTALAELSPSIALPLVERLLGSVRVGSPGEARALTEVEWTVLDAVFGRLLELLGEAWSALAPTRLRAVRRESDPGSLSWRQPEESAVSIMLELILGEQRGSLTLVYPTASFEAALAAMGSAAAGGGRGGETALAERLAGAELRLTVELPVGTVRLGDLRSLRPGDVVVTGTPASGAVELRAEGCPVFEGRIGRHGEWKAVRIGGRLSRAEARALPGAAVRKVAPEGGGELPGLADLPLDAAAVVAEKEISLGEAVGLRPGDLVAFPRRADELLDLRIGGRTVARGSAVRLGERFGLRLSGGP
jgi:flagellar motor switch protein FliM